MGDRGFAAFEEHWTPEAHLERYFAIMSEMRAALLSLVSQLKMYTRYAAGLPGFLRNTIADAEAMVRRGMEQREANFLKLVERKRARQSAKSVRAVAASGSLRDGDLRDGSHARSRICVAFASRRRGLRYL